MFSRERVCYSIAVGGDVGAFQRPVLIRESDVLSSINCKMPTFSFTAGLSLDEAVSHHGSRPFVAGLSVLQLSVRTVLVLHGSVGADEKSLNKRGRKVQSLPARAAPAPFRPQDFGRREQ